MIKSYFIDLFTKNKNLILDESEQIREFMHLLMIPTNTGVKWTKEEIKLLKKHLKHLSLYVPALIIFMLPFGALLLPVLAEVLDRRKHRRDHE